MTDTVELTPEQEDQEAAAALRAGYEKASGQDDAPIETEKVEDPAPQAGKVGDAAAAEVKAEAVPDPWEGVPAVVRQTLEGITSKLGGITDLQNEVKAGTGRIAAIQRELATKAKQGGEPAPTKQAIVAAFESPEKLKKLTEEWPDVGEAVADALQRERAEVARLVAAQIQGQIPTVDVEGIKGAVSKIVSEGNAESNRLVREYVRVDLKHPGWEGDIFAPTGGHTPEFAAWKSTQPPEMQALIESERASDAIKMLDAFYADRKAQAKRTTNKERLESVVTPPQASTGGPSVLPDEAGLSVGYKRVSGQRA